MKLCILFAILSLALAVSAVSVRPTQRISVSGKLTCKGKPAKGIKVKLYDHDTFSLDDLIAQGKTGPDGTFRISGKAHEVTRITPKLNVYHKCGKTIPVCDYKFSIGIPKRFIDSQTTYDAGTLNLENKFPGQSTDCLN